MNKSHETQVAKYGGKDGYKAEMRRRRALVVKPSGFAAMDKQKVIDAARKGGQNRWNDKTQKSRQSS